jgi:hypothetical protein
VDLRLVWWAPFARAVLLWARPFNRADNFARAAGDIGFRFFDDPA